MFVVLYSFKVKQGKEEDFIKGWKGLTELIYKFEGSLGSRLHLESPLSYIAYAQWPSEFQFESSGNNLPEEATTYRNLMRSSCESIEVLMKLKMEHNLLKDKQFNK